MVNHTTDTLVITTFLEPEYVEQIRAVSPAIKVLYDPDLVGKPRYPADHYNLIERTPEQEALWREWLGQATILFDFDPTHRADLPELAPNVRWVQSPNAGIGQFIRRANYDKRMPHTIFTTASGVHARPLAEFCMMAILAFTRGLLPNLESQKARLWKRYAATDLEGRTLGILGVGKIGSETARMARGLGLRVLGIKRNIANQSPEEYHLDELYSPADLPTVLRQSDFFVIVAPHTDETERMIGAAELALLPRGAVLINIGRGAVIDEVALISALQSGQLGGAALDVFDVEPLPLDNPLWDLHNVIISPHSGSNTNRENRRLTELFCDNIRRYLAGEPLRNVLNLETLY